MEPSRTDDRRAVLLLALGAAVGIGLAGLGIARSGRYAQSLPPGAIAVVNGQSITREAFTRFAGAVASERRKDLDPTERRRLLDRLIDEELLLQRGIALGLARHEPTARRAIVAAVIASVSQGNQGAEPSEAQLHAFYTKHPERFTRSERTSVDAAFVSLRGRAEKEGWKRAEEITRRSRAGGSFDKARSALGDTPPAPLPAGPLPLETLRRYLGPTAALAAERLAPGETSEPIRGVGGYHVLLVRNRLPGELAPYDEVHDQVRSEYLRARDDDALQATLDGLRADAHIVVDEKALAAP